MGPTAFTMRLTFVRQGNRRYVTAVARTGRGIDQGMNLYDLILGNSALDRLANASYQIVIEGASCRERLSPHRAVLGAAGGD